MARVDPRLRLVMEEGSERFGERIGLRGEGDAATVEVLVEPTAAGPVRRVRLPVRELPGLAADPAVERIEADRPLFPELNWSRVECLAEAVHTGSPSLTGSGVVVAVLDSGIDYTHACFRRRDGGSRILALWDQAAEQQDGDVPFGREYLRGDLDSALAAGEPLDVVPHTDADGHGTHVAGIAAGDERAVGDPAALFTGIAPGADLLVVALDTAGATLGTSTRVVAALDWVRQRAGGRPVVVNLSQGTNVGGHCGESLLERHIDELSAQHGFVVVKSAGNEREWGIHAGGMLSPGEDHFVEFDVMPGNRLDDVIEVWFGPRDDITVGVVPPSGPATPRVDPGDSAAFDTVIGNRIRIDVDEDADGTGDRRASLILRAGAAGQLQPGRWSIALRTGAVTDGRFDAWIERAPRGRPGAPEQSRFVPEVRDPSRTITIPGTARRIVTVGSYVTKSHTPAAIGRLSGFSSHGPTRDGRDKPELTAPGEFVTAARAGWRDGNGLHTMLMGTSMAAPHVAGVVALMLQANPLLTAGRAAQVLRRAARRDGFTDLGPDTGWGAGKVDAEAAVRLARSANFPAIVAVHAEDGHVSVRTDVATTARLRLRGNRPATLESQEPSTVHTFDLSGVPAGDYRAGVEVAAEGWITEDDDEGRGYAVRTGPPVPAGPGLEDISGIDPVIAERLGKEGIEDLASLAATSHERLGEASGVPAEVVREQNWTGQARRLLAVEQGRRFTVVVVPRPGEEPTLGFDVLDTRTGEKAVDLDGPALLAFLEERAAEHPG